MIGFEEQLLVWGSFMIIEKKAAAKNIVGPKKATTCLLPYLK